MIAPRQSGSSPGHRPQLQSRPGAPPVTCGHAKPRGQVAGGHVSDSRPRGQPRGSGAQGAAGPRGHSESSSLNVAFIPLSAPGRAPWRQADPQHTAAPPGGLPYPRQVRVHRVISTSSGRSALKVSLARGVSLAGQLLQPQHDAPA